MSRTVRLSDLPPGGSGTICQVHGGKSLARLRELGVLAGTQVRIVRLAPLGDPIEIAVRGSMLSIRRSEAELIEVTTG